MLRQLTKTYCDGPRIPLHELPQFSKSFFMYYIVKEIEENFSYLLDTVKF